jgi:succinate dehydrogenase / fumarate reductase membrane anchor subunit
MSLRTPIGRVRGLGTAKDGVQHWWSQRLTAIALVPLGLWFVATVVAMAGADHQAFSAWLSSPLVAALMLLLIVATFWHAYLGIQVVIEDYVHRGAVKWTLLIAARFACILLGLVAVVAVLKVALGG